MTFQFTCDRCHKTYEVKSPAEFDDVHVAITSQKTETIHYSICKACAADLLIWLRGKK